MGKRGFLKKGQGEVKTTLLLVELVAVLLVLAFLLFTISHREGLVGHHDLDRELNDDARSSLPGQMTVSLRLSASAAFPGAES